MLQGHAGTIECSVRHRFESLETFKQKLPASR
jgi:hypothetical protein